MTKILLIAGLVLLGIFLFTCRGGAQQSDGQYEVLPVEEFEEKLRENPDYLLVDVRTPKEYKEGHIEGARNIDLFNSTEFEEKFGELDREEPVMLYCRSGKRSRRAANKLRDMGFSAIYDLKGGYLNWSDTHE